MTIITWANPLPAEELTYTAEERAIIEEFEDAVVWYVKRGTEAKMRRAINRWWQLHYPGQRIKFQKATWLVGRPLMSFFEPGDVWYMAAEKRYQLARLYQSGAMERAFARTGGRPGQMWIMCDVCGRKENQENPSKLPEGWKILPQGAIPKRVFCPSCRDRYSRKEAENAKKD